MKKQWWFFGVIIITGCLFLKYFEQILVFVGVLGKVLSPLIFGCIAAYILNIILRGLEHKFSFLDHVTGKKGKVMRQLKRPVCILFSFAIVLLIIAAVIGLIIPEIISSGQLLAKAIPVAFNNGIDWIEENADAFPVLQDSLQNIQIDWNKLFENVWSFAQTGLGSIFTSAVAIVGTVFGSVFNLVIGLIFAVYLLANKEKLGVQFKKLMKAYIPDHARKVMLEFLELLDQTFASFIVGQCTEAVVLGGLCTIGMLILRLPYAVMTGVIVGVTALIPIVGAYVGAGVGAFMILMLDPMKALIFLIFLVILQQLEGNIIYPKVVGSSIGLPGMWVLASVTVGGGLLGVPGMLLGVPVAATLYKWIRRCTDLRLKKADAQQKKDKEESET